MAPQEHSTVGVNVRLRFDTRNKANIRKMQQSLETQVLEMTYEKACRQVQVVCETENARQLRLRTLLLEEENHDLHTQLAQGDERIDELERFVLDLQDDVETVTGDFDAVQSDLRTKNREIETLNAELNSLSGVMMDSAKLLTEKLTLARELSTLKPELEYLRSQTASHQTLLAERLALQRQLSTLQVEVENGKRCTQRLAAKEGRSQADDAKLEAQLEAVQEELAKEKRDRQSVDREAQKASTLLENKITMYESRLDAFRTKLKGTKESLKETQAELQKAQVAKVRATTAVAPSGHISRNARKRAASEIDADTMIGTPGDLPAVKKSKAKPTMPGEKSTFSMTPFLNRTASVAPENTPQEGVKSSDQDDTETAAQSPSKPSKAKTQSQPNIRKTIEKAVSEDEDDAGKKLATLVIEKGKMPVSRPPPRKAMAAPKLTQVDEEAADSPVVPKEVALNVKASKAVLDDNMNDGAEKKKIKRKILGGSLGKTLFDEDDGDALRGDRSVGAARGRGTLGRGGLGGPKLGTGAAGGFGSFSPLKKDRKAGAA